MALPPLFHRLAGSLGLVALAAALLVGYGATTRLGPALADEYIYLAGAKHFALTGSLDARFYDADAILSIGYPHHDVHTPGYVLLLGSLMALAKGGYVTAIALNVVCYLALAFLVRALARALGADPRAAWLASAAFLVMPAFLAYVFWAMPELVLTALFLASLVVAARWGERRAGAIGAAMLFGLAVLVRESAVLALPAVLALLWTRRRVRWFLVSTLAFLLLVYAPLSRHRAPGGANFWMPTSGRAFGYQAVQAARQGRVLPAVELALARGRTNVGDVVSASWTERGFLLVFILLPAVALWHGRAVDERGRRFLAALVAVWVLLVLLLAFVYILAQWSGFRYLMFLMPAFLPFLAGRGGSLAAPGLAIVLGLVLVLGTWRILTAYKVSRQRRQEGITAYVERWVDPRSVQRIVLPSGFHWGWAHYPCEVVSSLPAGGGAALRQLERVIGFDVLALPGDSPLGSELDGRVRYRRLNPSEDDPPLLLYRRLAGPVRPEAGAR